MCMFCSFMIYPASKYMLKVNYRNTRKRCEICSKLTIKTPKTMLLTYELETCFTPFSTVFIDDFEQVNICNGCEGQHAKRFETFM